MTDVNNYVQHDVLYEHAETIFIQVKQDSSVIVFCGGSHCQCCFRRYNFILVVNTTRYITDL